MENIDIDKNIDIDIDKDNLKNIDIDIDMAILENIDIDIDIDKGILQNIDIDKISYRLGFGISNTPKYTSELVHFTFFNTMRPLSLSSNFGTLAHSALWGSCNGKLDIGIFHF